MRNAFIFCFNFSREQDNTIWNTWMKTDECELWILLTSSLRFETSNTFDIPLSDVGFVWPMPVVVANANAPRLGIALPYAPVVNGVPKPNANGGITLGAPNPFTEAQFRKKKKENKKNKIYLSMIISKRIKWLCD